MNLENSIRKVLNENYGGMPPMPMSGGMGQPPMGGEEEGQDPFAAMMGGMGGGMPPMGGGMPPIGGGRPPMGGGMPPMPQRRRPPMGGRGMPPMGGMGMGGGRPPMGF